MTHEDILNLYSNHRLSDAALDFLEHIKFHPCDLETNDKFEIINHVNSDVELIKKIFKSNFEVGFCETIDLECSNTSELYTNFLEINQKRKSIRNYSEVPMNLIDLSNFLKLFYSTTGSEDINFNGEILTRKIRNIASGGSLYPTEIYVINNRIEEIPQGVYHYNVINFQLEKLEVFDNEQSKKDFFKLLMHDDNRKSNIDFKNASVFILFSTVINKFSSKYQDFGIALSLMEIGEFIHSAYLSASTLDLACCPFGGVLNDKMRDFLSINNPLHYPIMCMALGHK